MAPHIASLFLATASKSRAKRRGGIWAKLRPRTAPLSM